MKQFKVKFFGYSRDRIERLYGREILVRFPNYESFWEEYIGQKICNKMLAPYGLSFPKNISNKEKAITKIIYERLTMAHYTLFCALAGAHYQLSILQRNCDDLITPRAYFRHWDSFENIYIRLGNAFNQVAHLWKLFFALRDLSLSTYSVSTLLEIINDDRRSNVRINVSNNLESLLKQRRKHGLFKEYRKCEKLLKILRNNIVHFAREGSILCNGRFLLPFKIRENTNWRKQVKNIIKQGGIATGRRALIDVSRAEVQINVLHAVLFDVFGEYLKSKNIKVSYPWR